MTIFHDSSSDMEARYRRAALLQQAAYNVEKVAQKTSLTPHWIGDSDCFWYRIKFNERICFQLVDAKAGVINEAFDHSALAEALAAISGNDVDEYNLPISKVRIILDPLQIVFSAFGDYFSYDEMTRKCKRVDCTLPPRAHNHLISPDGQMIAFVRDYNLWVKDCITQAEYALTYDGEELYSYALSPVSWGITTMPNIQAMWSPDSTTLLTVQTDTRQVQSTPVIYNLPSNDRFRPIADQYRIPYPGDEHVEELRVLTIEVNTRRQTSANYRRLPVTRCGGWGLFVDGLAWWSSDSKRAYFVDTERGEQVARVVELDPISGDTHILLQEISQTNIKHSLSKVDRSTLLPLPKTKELIWYSERSGWAHLYLYDLETGSLKNPITHGEWLVRQILHFDEHTRELFIQTGGRRVGRNPYYMDICRVNIDSGDVRVIADGNYEYTVMGPHSLLSMLSSVIDPDWQAGTIGVSPTGKYMVVTRSRVDAVPESLLLDCNGKKVLELETADISRLPKGWRWPEPVQLKAEDGVTDIWGVIFRPTDFDPDRLYPVIDASVCNAEIPGLPRGSFSNAETGDMLYLHAAAIAELGFIVVMIDGRGTINRDRNFVDFSYGCMSSVNYGKDRISGIKQLALCYPYMDIERVGIVGFKGQPGPVFGLLEYPEFYKVGVCLALNDPRLMSVCSGEYFEGFNPNKKEDKGPECLATNLQGKLLLIHGLLDRMAPAAITFRLVDALEKANKDFDLLILPNEGTRQESMAHIDSPYAWRRMWDYFVKNLQLVEPPKEFDLSVEVR